MSSPDDYTRGWAQGVADAGARLVACAAAELGAQHPLVLRMVLRLGALEDGKWKGPDDDD